MQNKIIIIILIIIFTSLFKINVYADYAPLQMFSGNIISNDPHGVILEKEILNINIDDKKDCGEMKPVYGCNGMFEVNADFYLNNPNDELLLHVYFPLPYFEARSERSDINFEMILNDQPISDLVKDTYKDNNPIAPGATVSRYAVFATIKLQKGVNKLTGKYTDYLQGPSKYIVKPGYKRMDYVLSSGRLWEGPIGELEINITFNSPINFERYIFNSRQYTFEQKSPVSLKYFAKDIEPIQDLSLDFLDSNIWNNIELIRSYDESNITFEQRKKLYSDLKVYVKNTPLSTDVIAYNRVVPINAMLNTTQRFAENNLRILVEDFQADEEMQTKYAEMNYAYLVENVDESSQLSSGVCINNDNSKFIENQKYMAKYNILAYTNIPNKQEYVNKIENYKTNCNPPTKTNQAPTQEPTVQNQQEVNKALVALPSNNNDLLYIGLISISVLVNIILIFRNQISKALSIIRKRLGK